MAPDPPVLCLSGLDPAGAAGGVRDLWALHRIGAGGLWVPTCLTAQAAGRVRSLHAVPEGYIERALDTLLDDSAGGTMPRAVKVGLVDSRATWSRLLPYLDRWAKEGIPIVVDPVRAPSAGGFEVADEVRDLLLGQLPALHPILTPNLPELRWLDPSSDAAALVERGARGVLVTGGHAADTVAVTDVYHDATGSTRLRRARHPTRRRGTGCVLSTLLTFHLGQGLEPRAAARVAGHMLWRFWNELTLEATPRLTPG